MSSNSTANDRLEIANNGTAVGQIGTNGMNVTYGGTTIGTFSGGSGNQALVITFNASATPAAVQALTQAITFRTLGDNPSTLQRTISWQLNDGDGSVSLIRHEARERDRDERSAGARRHDDRDGLQRAAQLQSLFQTRSPSPIPTVPTSRQVACS